MGPVRCMQCVQVLALNKRLMTVLEGRGSEGRTKRHTQSRQRSGLSETLQAFVPDSTAGGLLSCSGRRVQKHELHRCTAEGVEDPDSLYWPLHLTADEGDLLLTF